MAIFKCKICGGSLDIADGNSVAVCEYCGTKQTVPTTKDEVVANLFNRANNLRLKCEFDKAEQVYEKILDVDNTDAEAHWGLVLCKYGIEYVDDSKTNTKIPTCHRTLYSAVLADVDYIAAIENSDAEQKELYEAEAKVIDELQKNILNIVNNEEPFDVFICYKETDDDGKRTVDSSISNDIYYQLTQEGFKVFYAPITLEDKLGYEYEPYIFAALNSAKVMLVVGTKPEYFDSVWVRNEWSRYLKLMKSERSKLLIPCYKDMDAYELPDEFAHLQAQDMGKIGFISDVIRGLRKVLSYDTQVQALPEKRTKKQSKINKKTVHLWTNLKAKIKSNHILSFTMPKSTFCFFVFTIIFYIYSLVKMGIGGVRGYDLLNFSLICLPFVTPLLVFTKTIKIKKIAIVLETISLIWPISYCYNIPYSINNELFSPIVLTIVSGAIWMIFICLTKPIEGESKRKGKWCIFAISVVFSIVLVVLFDMFAISYVDYQYTKYIANKLENIEVGEHVWFGEYEQDNDETNGKEAIGWLILDKQEDKVLVISHYALDWKMFNDSGNSSSWKYSSLRKWLNSEFLNSAFTGNMHTLISTTNVTPGKNYENIEFPVEPTQDKVFLLSYEEANKYFKSNKERCCAPTKYAKAQGIGITDGCVHWWLRSPRAYYYRVPTGNSEGAKFLRQLKPYNKSIDYDYSKAAYANYAGGISTNGESLDRRGIGVRPAMWIDVSKAK